MTQQSHPSRGLNTVALLAIVSGALLAAIDLWVVDISSTQDSPPIGLFIGLLPALIAIVLVYPVVYYLNSRGVFWPSELTEIKSELAELRAEISGLRADLKG